MTEYRGVKKEVQAYMASVSGYGDRMGLGARFQNGKLMLSCGLGSHPREIDVPATVSKRTKTDLTKMLRRKGFVVKLEETI